ncbi:hypothetical protein BXZ70DRAFT_545350 [Cristinia sonorae]|uniref:Uncharacterized protein n=1 Tax=Cristinia sonorae TaxID=1940300 RepID=A0A8K0XL39_9AGAR|nr:hypothetical protein BXZ70DRAFT_545350 [Cristinia sonorae]
MPSLHPAFIALALLSTSALTLADLNVTSWIRPTSGDIYEPAQIIRCEFQSPSMIRSPGFRICVIPGDLDPDTDEGRKGEEDGSHCGALVFPDLREDGDVYLAEMTMPDVDSMLQCYLQMEDSAGDATTSPAFLLSPTKPIRGNAFAALPSTSSSTSSTLATPLTDESSSSMPSRIIVYVIPLTFVSLIVLTGTCIYLYRRRGSSSHSSNTHTLTFGRDTCNDDKCGDPITCAHRGSHSLTEKPNDANDIYTAYFLRSQPAPRGPRPSTKEPFPRTTRPRRSTVPARMFKDPASTTTMSRSSNSSGSSSGVSEDSPIGTVQRESRLPTAMTYDRIASQYLQPPSMSSSAIAAEAITPPRRLHTRRGTSASQGIGRRVTGGHGGTL